MDVNDKLNQYLDQGAILTDIYFDMYAKDEETLKNLAVGLSKKLTSFPNVLYSTFEIEKPEKHNDFYSTYIKGRLLVRDFITLIKLCIEYSPISIDIVKPSKLELDLSEALDILMEISKTTYTYKQYIYTKVLTPKNKEKILRLVEERVKIGKKLLKGGDNEDNKDRDK